MAATFIAPRVSIIVNGKLPEQKRTAVFIVDDHALVHDGLKSLLENEPDLLVCGEAGGAQVWRCFAFF